MNNRNGRSTEERVVASVLACARRHSLLAAGDRVLVACSGGPDSLVLLHVLWRLAKALGIKLRAVYVDHGLRAAARREGAKVETFAGTLGLAAETVTLQLRANPRQKVSMESARRARYAALERIATLRGATKIAVAHTASDQAETVLMRMVRGAGVRGLAGIPRQRGCLVRPLLDVTRPQVLAYVEKVGLHPVFDPTNANSSYFRNRVRSQILPLLLRENPRIEEALCKMADQFRALDGALDARARAGQTQSVKGLRRLPALVRGRVLEHAHQAALEALLSRPSGNAQIALPGPIRAVRRGDTLDFMP